MRIPFNEKYVLELGKAVYAFAYYEWNIIHIIDMVGGENFVKEYSRSHGETIYTSTKVFKELKKVTEQKNLTIETNMLNELKKIKDTFGALINERNALLHGHPITNEYGEQILNYQSNQSEVGRIRDKNWDVSSIQKFTTDVNEGIIRTSRLMETLNMD